MKLFIVDEDNRKIQLLGCNTYINEFPTGRLLPDDKLYEICVGTLEI